MNNISEFKFNIRLNLIPYDFEGPTYIMDELPLDVVRIIRIHGDYDWLDRTGGAKSDSTHKQTLIQRKIMAQDGFTDCDVVMDANFEEGKLKVSIITDKDFNEIRHVYDGYRKFDLTLLDCIKRVLNGALSDGIGENEIGLAEYQYNKYDIWLGAIETDEPLSKNGYFKINEITA